MAVVKPMEFSRRSVLRAFAACTITAAPVYGNAAGFLKGAGDVRKLWLYSRRSGEEVETVYWVDGEYIDEGILEISRLMRDWRLNEIKIIDRRTLDIMSACQAMLDSSQAFQLLSGYRSPQTNAMLRRKSSRVARNSLHMVGKAADLRMSNRSTTQIARAATTCRAGGVGRYSRAGFVHMDCGPIRTWRG
ncbi:MAG: DUF882 domain-containing protein [Rhodobacteraceae bacterium]|nr:DUF882 domain-containing protein [Paracoccaceae bacterium]